MIVKYDNTWLKVGNVICSTATDPLNPLGLPPFTVRVRTRNAQPPDKSAVGRTSYDTSTLVDGTTNVYDVAKNNSDMSRLLCMSANVTEILGANTKDATSLSDAFSGCYELRSIPLFDTSSCTDMSYMLAYCDGIATVPLFNTSSCTNMSYMFDYCYSLKSVPLLDTANVTNMSYMFDNCVNVESGALALYQQASSQVNPPTSHAYCFYNCGSNTTTGTAELAQIPQSWGGTGT